MKKYIIIKNDEINFKSLISLIFSKKKFIIYFSLVSMMISVFIALSINNIYTSHALLAPKNYDEQLKNKLGAYSSLATLAGVSLPMEGITKSQEAVERIQSFEFFSKHFFPYIKLEDLMAVKKWDAVNRKIIYDKKIYDQENKEWVRKVTFPKKVKPSEQESFLIFKEKMIIEVDQKTSFVKISIDHFSPDIAKNWLDIIIKNINESMRSEDQEISRNSIDFLNQTIKSTNIQPLKDAISSLLEIQTQTLMLASSNDAYVFKIIDSPFVPEKKSRPNRALLCIFISILGFIMSISIVLLRNFIKNTQENNV